ncbi:MAG: glycosyltransferase [Elainellaceae cyanobacterium]
METSRPPFVSVIIPVFNDEERLKLCLAALAQQTYGRSHYEIIVVDNDSDHPELLKAVTEPFENVRLAYESTPGSYAARNRGLSLAKGEAIAFTDADCIPAPDWLEKGVYYLQHTPNCGQVIGKVELFFADPQAPTPVELYESVTAFSQEKLLQRFHGGATANVFTWRHVVDKVGGFDTQFRSGGDMEWGHRIYTKGYQQIYVEEVLVQHPARSSFQELYTRTRRITGGHYDIQLNQAQAVWQRQVIILRILLQNLVPPVFFTINTFFDNRLKGLDQKLKVSSLMFVVRYISALEILRLKLGGKSIRT